jgi:hypothetical protein
MADAIRIDGLAAFSRNLRKLDAELPKALRVALNGVADVVVADARPNVPQITGRARASIKARSTRTEVRVAAGGNKAPYYPWLDFGGSVGKHKSTKRAFFKDGRYLYPAYFRKRDSGEIQTAMISALRHVASQAGLEVT